MGRVAMDPTEVVRAYALDMAIARGVLSPTQRGYADIAMMVLAAIVFRSPEFAEAGAFEANAPTLYNLGRQLRAEQAASAFTKSGGLSEEAPFRTQGRSAPGTLGNPAIPEGFGKFATDTFQSPSGPFQVHFYMNPTTSEIFYGRDYKAVFNDGVIFYTPGVP